MAKAGIFVKEIFRILDFEVPSTQHEGVGVKVEVYQTQIQSRWYERWLHNAGVGYGINVAANTGVGLVMMGDDNDIQMPELEFDLLSLGLLLELW